MSTSEKPVIVVVGSLHYDIMVDAPDRPRKGETITGFSWRPKFGGKGGNQAVAAAGAGAEVRMVGAVGDEDFGRFLLDRLVAGGVDASHVTRLPEVGSGMSVAISDSGGDYGAVIVSGSNLLLDPAVLADPALWSSAKALILQNEMPNAVNIAAARAARAAGVLVCLNAAPSRPLPEKLTALIDLLVVNAIEAEQLGGLRVTDLPSAADAARALAERFPAVVVTAGEDGVAGMRRGAHPVMLPALPVTLVSTHGAGDVFVGTLVSRLAAGHSFDDCLRSANEAAAIHVSTTPLAERKFLP
ncbi:bifunctional hydroxymethylpyrimidine kinase/phosphomethylpyrimidine kinase [Pseudaminobacter sp. 19-2017]|uniref:Ribokinase n=1 Tax=Pseudaminobacter soli (ex Zhang et al. 2022) TaxID=2831468 RepID=A0A942DZE5_9HYPH|nr:PfkB family carbohydrate kinase [Pseudaminobacter soli]MBS3650233.1 bifunctional hydroxymethylpyrimidine kinase/phosphomethylpyrimidine kinase [Pseudaminobacter soli]